MSAADTRFPERPSRIVVAFTAGTAVDVVARTIAVKLSDSRGKPGLGGDIAAGTAEDLERTMKTGREKWARLVREIETQRR